MHIQTRLRSLSMRALASARFAKLRRQRARWRRSLTGQNPQVHYFHQVDDPYSHLVVQRLDALRNAYGIPLQVHLVTAPGVDYQGNPERFTAWAVRDAQAIAPGYGLRLNCQRQPAPDQVQQANELLAPLQRNAEFARHAIAVGSALWAGGDFDQPMFSDLNPSTSAATDALRQGDALRHKLGHYAGAMFYFEGEWYWGVDRVHLLEQRLRAEGFATQSTALCVPPPVAVDTTGLQANTIVLEYFPSLRSPYTAIGHQRVLDLVARSGVTVAVRPVMPMLMRGVPAPQAKQLHIISDAGREARHYKVPFGNIVDPFGDPVRQAFALFPGALAMNKSMEFVTAYLNAAWADGIDITTTEGLHTVASNAGLFWQELLAANAENDWETVLDDNLNTMLDAGLWGVPSFRVSGGNKDQAFACWGQDRIWRVENEIAQRALSSP